MPKSENSTGSAAPVRIVVLGGGVAGLTAARHLEARFGGRRQASVRTLPWHRGAFGMTSACARRDVIPRERST